MSTKTLIVCFDIDGTLRGLQTDQLYYHNIDLLRWFHGNGHKVYVWSGGGVEYAERFIERVGLKRFVDAVVPKGKEQAEKMGVDICFDDEVVDLAKINVQV